MLHAGEVRDDGEGAPVRMVVGELALRTFAEAHQSACAGVRRGAVYPGSSYEATGVPRHLLLAMLVVDLASLATRMRVRGAACAPRRQAGRDPHLHAPSTHLLQLATARVL